jgi:phospholipase C
MKKRHTFSGLVFLAALCSAVQIRAATPDEATATPIKHVIVVLAENRSFDHLFGLYKPPAGQTVFNILSEGIVKDDGTPGPNFLKATQYEARVEETYDPAPTAKEMYSTLPPPMTGSAPQTASDTEGPPFLSPALAVRDQGLPPSAWHLLLSGATGLPKRVIDTRIKNVNVLPDGPYPLTPALPYDAYTSSPVHRFFQMWQEMDCRADKATPANVSGCLNDLFPWVETSVGAGSNGKEQPKLFNNLSTGEGSTAMGFYNMSKGDAPYLKKLADQFTLSDNFHQAVNGGTGANHIMLGAGDLIFYEDAEGNAVTPPAGQIEDPDPQQHTNNYYRQDGYKGGSYVDCADL